MRRQYLYHAVPPAQIGDVLVPLNRLRALGPGLWEREVAKYAGRERVLDFRIPTLGVLWNDTIHLSPIHPGHLAAAWKAAGLWSPIWDRAWYRIPAGRLVGVPAVWFASEA